MSRQPRPFASFPFVHGDAYAIGRTVRAAPGAALAEAANSACLDFLAQRLYLPRCAGGTFRLFYKPSAPARYLWIAAAATKRGVSVLGDEVLLDLSITDGTSTVSSADSRIPAGLKADRGLVPASHARWSGAAQGEWFLDLDDLATTLDRTVPWRVSVAVTCDTTAQLEYLSAQELPRWWVDDSEAFGVLPGEILPRSIVEDDAQTERLVATLETAHSLPRTYLHNVTDEVAGPYMTATATSFTALAGWEESAGVSLVHTVRAERLFPAGTGTSGIRCKARCRYKINGTSATLRVITGAGTYDLALSDTSGMWTDSGDLTLYLATNGTDQIDTIELKAKLAGTGPTLTIASIGVWGDPQG